MSMVTIERVPYGKWSSCVRLTNGIIELIVTTEVGPRVIRFGFIGDDNEFKEYAEQSGITGGDAWCPYGGHRLWHAPEAAPRSYYPDNAPVRAEQVSEWTRFASPLETTTGIEKEIDIRLSENSACVTVVHRLHNTNLWAIECAVWALSVMAQGGVAIVPLPPRGEHPRDLLPASTLILWAYTDMSDARWHWGNRYFTLHQDPGVFRPQKIGASVPDGWVAYSRNDHLFVKQFDFNARATYPDLGACVEVFTNADMLELETLGKLTRIEPGASIEYTEQWSLFDQVPPLRDEDAIDLHVLPRIKSIPR
jgi:hypothetical protein